MKDLKLIFFLAAIILSCSCTPEPAVNFTSAGRVAEIEEAPAPDVFKRPKKPGRRIARATAGFVADCARTGSFTVKGKTEGQPCEADSPENPGNYVLPPEYHFSQAVIVSEYIAELPEGVDIMKGVKATGTDLWVLSRNQKAFSLLNGLSGTGTGRVLNIRARTESVWARDWSPLMSLPAVASADNSLKMIDTNYYSHRPVDDSVSRQIRNEILKKPQENLSMKRVSLPVYLEGGNIMCSSSDCYLSSKVIEQNKTSEDQKDLLFDEPGLKKEFKKQLRQDTWFIEPMPYEPTQHIDMWAKLLDEDTLLISELSMAAISSGENKDREKFLEIREFLETQAAGKDPASLAYIARKNNPALKIVRVPMPVPVIYEGKSADEATEIFRSYTNALLLNGNALVPRYRNNQVEGSIYPDNSLISGYEKEVGSAYENAGYKVIWLNSDSFIGLGGAIHCITMQVPGGK